MIIECPHCRTKFSIDDSLVARTKSPKFHCSRCDNYFTQQSDPSAAYAETFGSAPSVATDFDFMSVEPPATPELETDPTFEEETPYKFEEIDGEGASEESDFEEESFTLESGNLDYLDTPLDIQLPESMTAQPRVERTAFVSTSILFALYPICLTVVFFLLSQGLGRIPHTLSDQLMLSGDKVPLLPPFGLDTRGVKGDVQVLEDGSKVFDLRGEIHNTLPSSYRSLLIEGKLFDEGNQLIARMVAPVGTDLQGAKIHSLSKAAIDEITKKVVVEDNFVAGSKIKPFRLIFTGIKNPERVRYVGARIYSVEK